uniref:Uncharacterized protein n=1 Tax=Arundo donax TaxID=35708 RepID=A0A0A9ELJ8_ARUDO
MVAGGLPRRCPRRSRPNGDYSTT